MTDRDTRRSDDRVDSTPADPADSTPDATADPPSRFRAWIELYDDDPNVCTIYAAGERSVRTTWISAEEGSYVGLETMR